MLFSLAENLIRAMTLRKQGQNIKCFSYSFLCFYAHFLPRLFEKVRLLKFKKHPVKDISSLTTQRDTIGGASCMECEDDDVFIRIRDL